MIRIGGAEISVTDPEVLAGAVLAVLALVLLAVLRLTARQAAQMRDLTDGQSRLTGGLTHVAEAQAAAQAQTLRLMEQRLAEVTARMGESLHGSTTRTAASLGALQQRLETIDRAQSNIEKLSGDVLSLQDILSNKQTRGAFGEIQLHEIVRQALPPDSYQWQATLPNGRRADCLIRLPNPPGPIVIDSKFPLEAYEALRAAGTEVEKTAAARAMRTALRGHIRAIAEKYILPGETGEGALMFLPSEAVYAELHANFADVVREGFEARVWIVSPTTCMATLNTLRAVLKDARMREQAGAIRTTLRQLHRDVEMVTERVERLRTHFGQARGDLDGIATAADRAGKRAARLEAFDFAEEPVPDRVQDSAPTRVQIVRTGDQT